MERLRAARNGSALERQAALEAEVRLLEQRRTLNQRRAAEANLDRQRAKVAQQQQAAAQAALVEYCIEDEGQQQRAARLEQEVAEARAEAEAAHAQAEAQAAAHESVLQQSAVALEKAKAELAGQTAELERLRSIAEPNVAYFKQKTQSHAFAAAVDLAIIESLCLGVARNK
eukprot:7380427-Prymnesium_polylepis.1